MAHTILVLNTGSTSTKLAVYLDTKLVEKKEYTHSREFLHNYPYMSDQLPMRQQLAEEFVETVAAPYAPFSAIVARGGILCPIRSGGYIINETMVDYLLNICAEEHASNVAAVIAYSLKQKFSIPAAYIYDGITTHELDLIAEINGIPEIPRVSITHALNMRAIAHKAAADRNMDYHSCTMIVAHMGGGISLSLHHNGRMIDFVGDDEGPFSPERCGGQQTAQLVKYLQTKKTLRDQLRVIRGDSGLNGYFGTSDARVVEKMIQDGDEKAKLVYEAMAYQAAKAIGTLSVVTCGKVDAIALTGGLAHSQMFTGLIEKRVSFIAPVVVYPGENEMESLAAGAYRILSGKEATREFRYERKA